MVEKRSSSKTMKQCGTWNNLTLRLVAQTLTLPYRGANLTP
jgi:hypothetical protein